MSDIRIIESAERADAVSRLLEAKLYEFNVGATGLADGRALCFTIADEGGTMVAGIAGYTSGGCCHVKELWVSEGWRRRRLGSALVAAVEGEARLRNCARIIITTHSFQAPGFYARLGYAEVGRVEGDPVGHANIILAKELTAEKLAP